MDAEVAAAPAVPGGAAGTSLTADGAARKDSSSSKVAYVPPKTADLRFSPLRTTVLTAIDALLRQHPPCFTAAVCAHLPDIAAAIKYTDADTRMSSCALIATLLQPDRRKALQNAAEWPRAREQLFDMYVRGSSAEHTAEAAKPDTRDTLVVSYIELAALTALIKLQSLPAMRGHVPLRLLELVGESESLQRAVADSDALEHLTAFILAAVRPSPLQRPSLRSSSRSRQVVTMSIMFRLYHFYYCNNVEYQNLLNIEPRPRLCYRFQYFVLILCCTLQTDNAPWRRRSSSGVTANNPPGAAGPSTPSLVASSACLPEPDSDSLVTPSEEATLQLLSALQCIKLLCTCAPTAAPGATVGDTQSKAATPGQSVRNCCATATPAHLRALSCCLRHPSAAVRTASAQVRPCTF